MVAGRFLETSGPGRPMQARRNILGYFFRDTLLNEPYIEDDVGGGVSCENTKGPVEARGHDGSVGFDTAVEGV